MAESGNRHADLDAIYRLQVRTNAEVDLNKMGTTSLEDIAHVGQDGHAVVDTNRLVYDYKKQSKSERVREKVMWYLPDYTFILINLASLVACVYFVVVGISALTWYENMGMFSIPNCVRIVNGSLSSGPSSWEGNTRPEDDFFYAPCKYFTDSNTWTHQGYNFSSENNFPIMRTKLTEVHYFGLFLILLQVINIVNVFVGIYGCLKGYKNILIQHVCLDGFVIFCEMTICGLLTFTSVCEPDDLEAVMVLLRHYVNNYDMEIRAPANESEKEKMISLEVDHLQMSLGCCGVSGWEDYLEARYPESDWPHFTAGLDNTEEVIPYSCCQPWWIRNIYCSRGAHLWVSPFAGPEKALQFQERIVSDGCAYKLDKMCQVLKNFMGLYGLIVAVVHLLIVMLEIASVIVIIRLINTLIKEKKRLMKKKELTHEVGESTSDVDIRKSIVDMARLRSSRKSTLGSPEPRITHVAPPTEDEIYDIKTRSNFNRFITKLRYTPVATWMETAVLGVTEGHEQKAAGKTKKAREKELLLHKNTDEKRRKLIKIKPPPPPPSEPEQKPEQPKPEPKPVPKPKHKPKPKPKSKPEPVPAPEPEPEPEAKVKKKKLRRWVKRVPRPGWSQDYAQFRSLEKPDSKPSVKVVARREKLPEGLSNKGSGKLSEKLAKEIASVGSKYKKTPTKKPTVILFKKDKGKKEKEEEKLEESRTTLQTETDVETITNVEEETTTNAEDEEEMPKQGTGKRKRRRKKKIRRNNSAYDWSDWYSNLDALGKKPYT